MEIHSSSNSKKTKIHHRSSDCHLELSDFLLSSLNYDTKQTMLSPGANTMKTTENLALCASEDKPRKCLVTS